MAGRLEGKVAVVTASAGAGIGQAIARKFAAEGANVVVADAHKREDGTSRTTEVAADIAKATGQRSIGVVCDVSSRESVKALADAALKEFGRVDILVNNAARNVVAPIHKATDEIWNTVLGVNLKGLYFCARAFLPGMVERRRGRIISISSFGGWIGSPFGEVPYLSTKAGIMAFTRSLALEMAPHGVTVNAVAPGVTMNPFLARQYSKEMLQEMERMSPTGRTGKPEDIANTVAFLASDEADYVTGEIWMVAGGQWVR
jgi:3-oxoacyl-[acyl-carrier protein] reductase